MPNEFQRLLKGIPTVHERSPELLGYEPTTSSFDPDDDDEARQFLALWAEAKDAGAVVKASRDDSGRLTLCRHVSAFWS